MCRGGGGGGVGLFDFGLALQLSIHLSTYHTFLASPSPARRLCRLDLSQLFAGFKDKEILIELLCNSTSQCITRQLDINRPPFSVCVCVHLHVCIRVYVCVRFVYLWLKAFPLIRQEAAVICSHRPRLLVPRGGLCLLMWVSTHNTCFHVKRVSLRGVRRFV